MRDVNDQPQPSSVVRLLVLERRRLQQEIERIDRILARESDVDLQNIAAIEREPDSTAGSCRPNTLTKTQALKKALEVASAPLSPREIVVAIRRLGYTFTSAHPENTLNPYLYGAKKLPFLKKFGRGFILAERESEFQTPPPTAEGSALLAPPP